MSKKQWGHGFYSGLKAADNYQGLKRYIAILAQDQHIKNLYRVLAENGDIFTVEDITNDISILSLTGIPSLFSITGKEDDACPEMVSEIVGDDEMLFFSSKAACENYVLKDFNKWKSEVVE